MKADLSTISEIAYMGWRNAQSQFYYWEKQTKEREMLCDHGHKSEKYQGVSSIEDQESYSSKEEYLENNTENHQMSTQI